MLRLSRSGQAATSSAAAMVPTVAHRARPLHRRAKTIAAADTRRSPVYARVDGILANGRFLLMELELIEPYLYLPESPEATTKLASAVATRLS